MNSTLVKFQTIHSKYAYVIPFYNELHYIDTKNNVILKITKNNVDVRNVVLVDSMICQEQFPFNVNVKTIDNSVAIVHIEKKVWQDVHNFYVYDRHSLQFNHIAFFTYYSILDFNAFRCHTQYDPNDIVFVHIKNIIWNSSIYELIFWSVTGQCKIGFVIVQRDCRIFKRGSNVYIKCDGKIQQILLSNNGIKLIDQNFVLNNQERLIDIFNFAQVSHIFNIYLLCHNYNNNVIEYRLVKINDTPFEPKISTSYTDIQIITKN